MKDAVVEENIKDLSAEFGVDEDKGADPVVYEVGYHILPTVAEDAVQGEVDALMSALKKFEAEVIGDKAPVRVDLAYTLTKKMDGSLRKFESAYFGWVAFALPAKMIAAVKTVMDKHPNVLRYLIVKTSREAVAANLAEPTVDISTKVLREAEAGGEVSEVALDSALKQIEADDVKSEEKA